MMAVRVLRAGSFKLWAALLMTLIAMAAGQSTSAFAGTAAITISPGAPTLDCDTQSNIQVSITDAVGDPIANATPVTFATTLGTINSPRTTTAGVATSQLSIPPRTSGLATITVTAAGMTATENLTINCPGYGFTINPSNTSNPSSSSLPPPPPPPGSQVPQTSQTPTTPPATTGSTTATQASGFGQVKSFHVDVSLVPAGGAAGAQQTSLDFILPNKVHFSSGAVEIIVIGSDSYSKSNGVWTKQAAGTANPIVDPTTFTNQLAGSLSDPGTPGGMDSVNGTQCQKYSKTAPDGSTAEICIANGLPLRLVNSSASAVATLVFGNYNAVVDFGPPI